MVVVDTKTFCPNCKRTCKLVTYSTNGGDFVTDIMCKCKYVIPGSTNDVDWQVSRDIARKLIKSDG